MLRNQLLSFNLFSFLSFNNLSMVKIIPIKNKDTIGILFLSKLSVNIKTTPIS